MLSVFLDPHGRGRRCHDRGVRSLLLAKLIPKSSYSGLGGAYRIPSKAGSNMG